LGADVALGVVWDRHGPCDLEALPVSPALRAELDAWAQEVEHGHDRSPEGLLAEGADLAVALASELQARVFYEDRVYLPGDGPVSRA
jgi:hypothetical protein